MLQIAVWFANLPSVRQQAAAWYCGRLNVRTLNGRYRIDGTSGRVDAREGRVVGHRSLEASQRFLRGALRIIAQGGELEQVEAWTKEEGGTIRVHFHRVPDVWIRCTVVGPELVMTTQSAVIPTLGSWVGYTAVLASSRRWRTREGKPFVRICPECKLLFVVTEKNGRPAATCSRAECATARSRRLAGERQSKHRGSRRKS